MVVNLCVSQSHFLRHDPQLYAFIPLIDISLQTNPWVELALFFDVQRIVNKMALKKSW